MGIVGRVKETGLPLNELVVIGSGVLDALKLRAADDIDMVVTGELFDKLRRNDSYKVSEIHGEIVLQKDEQEIWTSWGSNGIPNFNDLYSEGITIDGVRFCNPEFVLQWKKQYKRPKDIGDIELLSNFLKNDSTT